MTEIYSRLDRVVAWAGLCPVSAWIPMNQRFCRVGEVGLREQQHKPSADVPVKGRQRGLQMNWCVKGWKHFSRSALSFVMFL